MTDQEIISLLQRDAAAGISALTERYGGLITGVCRAVLRRPEDAEEAAADTLVHLWRHADNFGTDICLSAVAANIARQRSIDTLRKIQRSSTVELPEEIAEAFTLADEIESSDQAAALHDLIASLPPPDGELVLRKYYYLESTRAIAARCGMTENAVNCRLTRAKQLLRTQLTALLEEIV